MQLLTFHGTLVRCSGGVLTHGPLSPEGYAPPLDLAAHGFTLARPGSAPWVHITQGAQLLAAERQTPQLQPAAQAGENARFLPLTAPQAEALGRLLGYHWHAPGAASAHSAALLPYFHLTLAGRMLDLAHAKPELDAQGRLVLPASSALDSPLMLTQGAPTQRPWPLHPAQMRFAHHAGPLTQGQALPITAIDALTPPRFLPGNDSDIFHHRFWNGYPPFVGAYPSGCHIVRAPEKYVLQQRYFEGIIFDAHGTHGEAGYLNDRHPPFPPGLSRELGTIMIDRAALAAAPSLPEPHVVFCNPHLQNYYHALVESLLPLDLMRPHLPKNTRLLLPPTLTENPGGLDYRHMLDVLGLADMPTTQNPAPVVKLQDAIWLEGYAIHCLPGPALRAFRNRLQARPGTAPAAPRRIFIQRSGLRATSNADDVETLLTKLGFTQIQPETLSFESQISLFQQANFVIATHGAALSNLLFCAPGTRVIELMPGTEFRPFYWLIAEKLGLRYAALPCATATPDFNSAITVNCDRLAQIIEYLAA